MRYKLIFCIQFGRNSIFEVLQHITAHHLPCSTLLHITSPTAHYCTSPPLQHITAQHLSCSTLLHITSPTAHYCTSPPLQHIIAHHLPCSTLLHITSPALTSTIYFSPILVIFTANYSRCSAQTALCLIAFCNVTPCSPVNAY